MARAKILKIVFALTVILAIVGAILDTYVLKSDGFGLVFSIGAGLYFIVLPAAVILIALDGTGKIAMSLTSKKVTATEKKGILKRMIIVIVFGAIAIGLFAILNTIGTKLIDI